MGSLPVIRAEGTHYEMGYGHGEQCLERIQYMAREGLLREMRRYAKNTDLSLMLKLANEYEPFIREGAPHLLEEIRGIGDGSRITYQEALMLQCRSELVYKVKTEPECTSFALERDRSATGEVIVGQNLDLGAAMEDGAIILCLYPTEGPAIVNWTIAGTVGQIGLNSAGLGRCGNVLISDGWRAGLPTTILFRRILEQSSVRAAEAFIAGSYRAKSNNFMLGDETGYVMDLETTANDFRILQPKDGILTHTNHYLHPDLIPYELFYDVEDSALRLSRLNELLASSSRKVTPEKLKTFLTDHANGSHSICKHVEKDSVRAKTVASIMLYPESRTMEVCPGNPCTGQFTTYRL
jgi:isopenicillin-N N-acyltransferase like protein